MTKTSLARPINDDEEESLRFRTTMLIAVFSSLFAGLVGGIVGIVTNNILPGIFCAMVLSLVMVGLVPTEIGDCQ